MKTPLEKQREMDEENVRCARLILKAPEKYAGIGVEWVRRVLARAEGKGLDGDSAVTGEK